MDAKVEPVVVLGCPRSGTTYLMKVLNTLPDAECMSGTLLPVTIPHIVNRNLPQEVYDALAVGFERALDDYLHTGRYHSRSAAVQKWFAAPTTGPGGLLKALRGPRAFPRWMIYKEPFLSLAPDFVHRAIPKAKIIHIYRDGRDAANSLVRTYDVLTDDKLAHLRSAEMRLGRPYDHRYVPWWVEEGREQEFMSSTPYVRAIWMWKYMVRRCHDFFSRPALQGQVLLLRYEDFMRDPKTHGRAVLEHIGAAPNASLKRRLKGAHTASIGKYRRRPHEEVAAAERVAGAELKLYGYKVPPHPAHAE